MKKIGTLRSQAGFSLVELMVVVAIIGVLAAMSAGQVQKQIAKARQSEAKTNLATLWSSMESFRAEYNQYTTDFVAMKLSFGGKLYYNLGFSANTAPPASYTGTVNAAAFNTGAGMAKNAVTCANCVLMPGAGTVAVATVTVATNTYISRAIGQPNAPNNDEWSITESKVLTNSVDGIP